MNAVSPSPHGALLSGQNLSIRFDGRTLFDTLNLDIFQGDRLAILGESGSGKSTLLHILAGLERPTQGQVRVNGVDIWTQTADQRNAIRRRSIGLVFQAFYLLPHLSTRQNVALPWILDGSIPDEERIDRLLARVGLSHRADASPAQLSGGEQQRTAIARALALNPPLILADEPTGNLDPRNAAAVMDLLLEETAANGHALLMVTHSHKAADRLDRRLQLESGHLQVLAT